jgi:hypothetical protein
MEGGMATVEKVVRSTDELVAAAADRDIKSVIVSGHLTDAPRINLLPGQSL